MNTNQMPVSQPSTQYFQKVSDTFGALTTLPPGVEVKQKRHLRRLCSAMEIATQAHEGQVRKDGSLTIGHPHRVAQNLLLTGVAIGDDELLCAGLLHDVIEDADRPARYRKDIELKCGKRVLRLVEAVTKPACPHHRPRCPACEKRFISRVLIRSLRDPAVLHLKLADIADNLNTLSGLSPAAALRYVRISRVYIGFAYFRLGGLNRSCRLSTRRLREAEGRMGSGVFRRLGVSTRLMLLLVALTALIACSMGCSHPAPLAVEVGFDVTPKNIKERINKASPFASFIKKEDVFTLRATDNKTSLIATARPVSDSDAHRLLTSVSGRIIPSTDLARYFETLADVAQQGDLPLVAVLYTDGLQDVGDPKTVAVRITAAARRLARAKRLRALVIAGTVRDVRPNWQGLPEMLAPVRSKLFVLPMATLNPDDVHRLVRQTRVMVPRRKGER